MIVLPARPRPRSYSPMPLDFGFQLKPVSGAPVLRVDRPGSRWRIGFDYPVIDDARTIEQFTTRLAQAKQEGVRVDLPLLEPQGAPGKAVVVDGAGQAGRTLALRGAQPHWRWREGYWLTIVDASDEDAAYVHKATSAGGIDAAGQGSIAIWPELRTPFEDGARVELARPFIEGFIKADWGWDVAVHQQVSCGFTVEEYA